MTWANMTLRFLSLPSHHRRNFSTVTSLPHRKHTMSPLQRQPGQYSLGKIIVVYCDSRRKNVSAARCWQTLKLI
jgi:hypothetical protein